MSKPSDVPPDFTTTPYTVIIDTREQAPFEFRSMTRLERYGGGPLIVKTKRLALPTGDYSIEGMQDQITIERKEMGDFFNCCGQDRERFEKQLSRLNEMEFACVVVEASFDMVMRGHRESKLKPESVRGSVIAWQQEHFPKVHWWFLGGKFLAEQTTFRMLDRWWRNHSESSH